MLYVLENNKFVINGPRIWNPKSFATTLIEDLEINFILPLVKDDDSILEIDANTHIYPAQLIEQNYNPTKEYLHGPFWDFSTGKAIGTYEISPYDIEFVKSKLKEQVKQNRKRKETSGTTVNIQNLNVSIDTSRDGKNTYFHKYLLMADTDTTQWKFPEGWLTLTKAELGQILTAIDSYIQTQFDWELEKINELDAILDIDDLDSVELGNIANLDAKSIGL